jgi:2-oxoglutarate ferredoxin oxidoreductase subunit alpha
VNNLDRLDRKFQTARKDVPQPTVENHPEAEIGIIGFGTSHWAIVESRDQLTEETDTNISYFRVRAYPFTPDLEEFIDRHKRIYVVEQNRDAQLAALMRLELTPERIAKLRNVLHYNGLPIDARSITDDILAQEGHEVAKRSDRATMGSAGMTGGE